MKVVFIRKSGDPERNDYFDCAMLVEPLLGQEEFSETLLVGVANGEIGLIAARPAKGLTYSVYYAEMPVRYQMETIGWIKEQIGKPVAKVRFWEKWFSRPQAIQRNRADKGVWTAAEFVFAALKRGHRLAFNNFEPHEMTPEFLSASPVLVLKGRIYTG